MPPSTVLLAKSLMRSMSDVVRTTLITLLACAVLAPGANGQRLDPEDQHLALSGLTTVEARVTVQWDMGITMRGGTTLSDFERDVEDAFELGLGRTGVSLHDAAGAHLDCVVILTHMENAKGSIELSRTVRLFRPDTPEDPVGRWTVIWSRGETRATTREALSGAAVGRDCASAFRRDWRRANPGS